MNTFQSNLKFEAAFTARLRDAVSPLLEQHNLRLQLMQRSGETTKSGLDKSLQQEVGDFLVSKISDGTYVYNVDLKVERRASENMFFETFSNATMDPERAKLGWGMKLKADRIWHAFDDIGALDGVERTASSIILSTRIER